MLIASIVITLAISLGWLIRFFSYSQMGIYFHLESFNENSTVPDEHEVDLHALQQVRLKRLIITYINLFFVSHELKYSTMIRGQLSTMASAGAQA